MGRLKKNEEIIIEKMGRKLVWHDEFSGSKLDKTKWTTERLMYNPELIYDNSENNLRVENGMLHLQVNRIEDIISTCHSVTTKHTMLFRYGYVEMRARVPFRHGAWPSFWMKGDTPFLRKADGRNNWFPETDIFEVFSSKDKASPNIHRWGNNNGESWHEMLSGTENGQCRNFTFENPDNLNDEFHIYGMLWEEHSIKFSVDGDFYFEAPIDERSSLNNDTCNDMMGFHDPQYLIINNEVFTSNLEWYPEGSALTSNDQMPIDYYVDYVRLYQRGGSETLYLCDAFK